MSLQTRLSAFAQAVGADIKALKGPKTLVADTPNPAGGINDSATDNAIQWVRASDGAWVAKVDPYLSGTQQVLDLTSRAKTDGHSALATLKAEENGTWNEFLGMYVAGDYSQIAVSQADSGTAEPRGIVSASAGGKTRKIIDSAGASDFHGAIPVVTAIPTAGVRTDGEEIYYRIQDAYGNYRLWHLKYDANLTSAHKWQWVGGHPWRKQLGTAGSYATRTSSNNNFEDSAAGVLGFTTPFAGDWQVRWGCGAFWNTTANGYAAMGIGVGTFTNVASNDLMRALFAPSAGHTEYAPMGEAPLMGLSQGNEIRVRFSRRAAVGTANFQEPLWLEVRPIRVG